ncbi:MAG: hypothetical protein ACI4S3_05185 [Candidatus Gastranaerophilaceae bacterium]
MTTGLTTSFVTPKIDKNMIESVTNAIFQRAASKASQAVENSTNTNVYNTDSFKSTLQNDMMSQARQSVTKSANPFAEGVYNSQAVSKQTEETVKSSSVTANKGTEVKAISKNAQRTPTKSRISGNMALQNGMFASAMRESVMVQAQEQMTQRRDLASSLLFLNTQKAVNTYPSKKF